MNEQIFSKINLGIDLIIKSQTTNSWKYLAKMYERLKFGKN